MLTTQADGVTGDYGEHVDGCPGYLLGVPFCVWQLGGHVKHDLLVAEVAVYGLGPRLPVSHVQASSEPVPRPPRPWLSIQLQSGLHGARMGLPPCSGTRSEQLFIWGLPLEILQFDFLAQKLKEFHKGRTFLVGPEWSSLSPTSSQSGHEQSPLAPGKLSALAEDG